MTNKSSDGKAKRSGNKIEKKISPLRKGDLKRPMDSGRFSRRIFDVAMDGIAIVDEQGVYLDSNQAYCRLLGYPREELIGKTPLDLATDDFRQYMLTNKDTILAKKYREFEGS